MRDYRFSSRAPRARVLCVSIRDIDPVLSRCTQFEFEDVASSVDAIDVIAPGDPIAPESGRSPAHKVQLTLGRLAAKVYRRVKVKAEALSPVLGRRRLPEGVRSDYELLFVSVEAPEDLYDIAPLAMWRSAARTTACYINELYVSDVAALGSLIEVLKGFDHVFLGMSATVAPLAEATGRPCHYLPPSIDALAFCPYPQSPPRVIDVYAMGHRPPQTHEALVRMAEPGDRYYMYDSVRNSPFTTYLEHRGRLAEAIKRSRFFLVNVASWHKGERVVGQQELAYRFVEGAAGGAILVGEAPRGASFDEFFGWPDAVIPLPFNSTEIAEVIGELEADPARMERISKTNLLHSLRRLDHLYRWDDVLAATGLASTAEMADRRRRLTELADAIERTIR